jgi:7-cyano-7-deazaguanine synthase in queuosine biosynthesis
MNNVVLFSGGCDSTLVLYRKAMEMQRTNNYDTITALTIRHDQLPAQDKQKQAQEAIIDEFCRKREFRINWSIIDIKQTSAYVDVGNGGLTHPVIWLNISALYIRDGETLFAGYHRGDDYWSKKHEAEQAFYNFGKIIGKPTIKLEYPLEFDTKATIIRNLKDRGLYEMCWWCEFPTSDGNTCGTCDPCITHKTALWQNSTLFSNTSTTCTVCSPQSSLPVDIIGSSVDAGTAKLKGS